MSGLLIIALSPTGAAPRWYRLDTDAGIAQSGSLDAGEAPELDTVTRICAIVPGDLVAMHWVDLPKASPAQAAAAARIMAADLSAGPIDEQHVAVARDVDANGQRVIAIVARSVMTRWLESLAAYGIEPDDMVPAPLLLPFEAERMSVARDGPFVLVRGENLALQTEPELAELVVPSSGARLIGGDLLSVYANGLENGVPINLRQGAFQKSSKLVVDTQALRRMGWLAAGLVLVTLAIPAVSALRYTFGASQNEQRLVEEARRALPGSEIVDPVMQVRTRLAQVGAGGSMAALSAAVFDAVRADGQFRVESIMYEASGGLRVTLASSSGVAASGLKSGIESRGYIVTEGATRTADDGQRTDIEVRAR